MLSHLLLPPASQRQSYGVNRAASALARLYWRVYETRFKRSDFKKRFGKEFNEIYGKYIKLFFLFGLIKKDDGNEVALSDKGTFWLHALQDLFSLDYISKLWGTSKQEPWPAKVVL